MPHVQDEKLTFGTRAGLLEGQGNWIVMIPINIVKVAAVVWFAAVITTTGGCMTSSGGTVPHVTQGDRSRPWDSQKKEPVISLEEIEKN